MHSRIPTLLLERIARFRQLSSAFAATNLMVLLALIAAPQLSYANGAAQPLCTAGALLGVITDGDVRISVKRLYAPPEDVERGVLALPRCDETPTISESMMQIAPLVPVKGVGTVARFAFTHGGGELRLLPLGPNALGWSVRVQAAHERVELGGASAQSSGRGALSPHRAQEVIASQEVFGAQLPTRCFMLEWPMGATHVDVQCTFDSGDTHAALVMDDDANEVLVAHLATRLNREGDALRVCVRGMTRTSASDGVVRVADTPRVLNGVARELRIESCEVRWSDGSSGLGAMQWNGAEATVSFEDAIVGDALVEIQAAVVDAHGHAISRSAHMLVSIAPRTVSLGATPRLVRALRSESIPRGGVGSEAIDGAATLEVPIVVAAEKRSDAPRSSEVAVYAATQLWAVSARSPRCLGWIGGLAQIETSERGTHVALEAPLAALALEEDEHLELRELRLHARDGCALLDFAARVEPAVDELTMQALRELDTSVHIAATCGRAGGASVGALPRNTMVPPLGSHALALVHGYCADVNGWPPTHFDADAWQYSNFLQNFSHDAFALDLYASGLGYKSFGVVAHSQGGCAALHLYNFYWSGLDWAAQGDPSGRLIQALASPLEGTALAGNLAALAEIFGVQCGANASLTYDGAAAWLSLIPTSSRTRVSTFTTTFTDNWWSVDACSFATDVFLSDPEDGVTEHWAGHIPGANNMGLVEGWCHVDFMNEPRNSRDPVRNASMNALGAR